MFENIFSVSDKNDLLRLIKSKILLLDEEGKQDEDLKKMFIELLLHCVESEKSSALKRILLWIKDIVASNETLENLVTYKWNLGEQEKEEGFIWNNKALIRASEKNNFHMVSHFMCINFGRRKGVDVVFQINDSKFRHDVSRGRFEIAWFEYQTEPCNEVLREASINQEFGGNFYILEIKKMKMLKKKEGNASFIESLSLRHYKNFEAACSPALLISRFRNAYRKTVCIEHRVASYTDHNW